LEVNRKDFVPEPQNNVSVPDMPLQAKKELKKAEEYKPLAVIDPCSLFGIPVPDRKWIVLEWLPVGYTTALYGDGGLGKTLVVQQLMTSCATGRPWLGLAVEPCKVFGLFCEDDEDELHRRQDAINCQYGINFSDLGNMRWVSGVGANNLLMTFERDGQGFRTDRLEELTQVVKLFAAKLVIIDTAADTFGGNENDRGQVRQFIGTALNKLARDIGGAVLLCAHPSRSGLSATGDLDGGSTAWSNTVRSRWSLTRPRDDDTPADTDERILTRRKANYAAKGLDIKMRWQRGVLVPLSASNDFAGLASRRSAEEVFLRCLDEANAAGRRVSDSKHAGNYAPKVFSKSPSAEEYKARDLTLAMERLFSAGTIRMMAYGRSGDARQCIGRSAEPMAEEEP
jgi:RecA-family ATPase